MSKVHRPAASRPKGAALLWLAALLVASIVGLGTTSAPAGAAPQAPARAAGPADDPFYRYTGTTPLSAIAPGTVLKTRTVPYHVVGFPLPVKTTQLLYRSTDVHGGPTVNVTSVVRPMFTLAKPRLVSYQSFYDSLSPEDQPSTVIAGGGLRLGGVIANIETLLLAPLLAQGYSIVIPDTEGQDANFAAGPEYGTNTLDSIRATFNSPAVGLPSTTKVAMTGYSGGAIATEWAAELAPTYAPDVNRRLVGSTMGGVLVNPARNLRYVEGSAIWTGVIPMALIGAARAYDVDLSPYLSDLGRELYETKGEASIVDMLGRYPFLQSSELLAPEYPSAEDIPEFVEIANQLIMGTGGTPTTPLLIHQGAGGEIEGTAGNKPGIGKGDGVMVAGDVRTLARQYCAAGTKVQYREHALLSHVGAAAPFLAETLVYINDRFDGRAAPQNCSQIAPGNSLAPLPAP